MELGGKYVTNDVGLMLMTRMLECIDRALSSQLTWMLMQGRQGVGEKFASSSSRAV